MATPPSPSKEKFTDWVIKSSINIGLTLAANRDLIPDGQPTEDVCYITLWMHLKAAEERLHRQWDAGAPHPSKTRFRDMRENLQKIADGMRQSMRENAEKIVGQFDGLSEEEVARILALLLSKDGTEH